MRTLSAALVALGVGLTCSTAGLHAQSLVADIRPGQSNSSITELTRVGDRLFFAANDGVSGAELWQSDGTTAGTSRVRDIRFWTAGSDPSGFTALGPLVVFRADDGIHGAEPWCSDGTTSGTRVLADIAMGSGGSDPEYFTRFGNHIVFTADDGFRGPEPWITDGTPAGTRMIADVNPSVSGVTGSHAQAFEELNGNLLFAAYRPDLGVELWTTDGTARPAGGALSRFALGQQPGRAARQRP